MLQLKVSNVLLFAEADGSYRSYVKLCSSVFNGPLAANLEVIILEMEFLLTVAHNFHIVILAMSFTFIKLYC